MIIQYYDRKLEIYLQLFRLQLLFHFYMSSAI